MTTTQKRLERLELLLGGPAGCSDPWHLAPESRLAVVYEDDITGELPAAPRCPSCGAAPATVISVVYEDTHPEAV